VTDPTAARWHDLYSEALFSADDSIILERITAAERAIAARGRELFSSPAITSRSFHSLDSARYALRALRGAVLRRAGRGSTELIALPTWPSGD
jgi:hypothetical protein